MIVVFAIAILVSGYAEERESILAQTDIGVELTDEEIIADSLFQDIKEEAYARQDPSNPWVGQFFPVVREEYESTGLFCFLREMPKGAILHVHPSAMGNYFELFDMVSGRQYCYYNPSSLSFVIFLDTIPVPA